MEAKYAKTDQRRDQAPRGRSITCAASPRYELHAPRQAALGLAASGSAAAGQLVLADQAVDVRPREVELAGGLGGGSPGGLEALAQVAARELLGGLVERRRGCGVGGPRGVREHVVLQDQGRAVAVGADDGGLDGVGELANIAGPRGLAAGEQGPAGEGERREAVALA